jgi:hypothetical protein
VMMAVALRFTVTCPSGPLLWSISPPLLQSQHWNCNSRRAKR